MNTVILIGYGVIVLGVGVWHTVLTRRELKSMPQKGFGPGMTFKVMFGWLPEPERTTYRRIAKRSFFLGLGTVILFLVIAFVMSSVQANE